MMVFTRSTLASAGTIVVVVCLSVRLSQVGVLLKRLNAESRKTAPHDGPETLLFCCRKSRQNSNGTPPVEAPDAGEVGLMQVR